MFQIIPQVMAYCFCEWNITLFPLHNSIIYLMAFLILSRIFDAQKLILFCVFSFFVVFFYIIFLCSLLILILFFIHSLLCFSSFFVFFFILCLIICSFFVVFLFILYIQFVWWLFDPYFRNATPLLDPGLFFYWW